MRKSIVILGATGSIGLNALDVVNSYPEEFKLVGVSACRNYKKIKELSLAFPEALTALREPVNNSTDIDFVGPDAVTQLIRRCQAELTINGIAGSAGLIPSLVALEYGDLALANKETIVMAGTIVKNKAISYGNSIIPVDSEHSGVFHLLQSKDRNSLEEIILTASGGPFRTWSYEAMEKVSSKQALAHPTWSMGAKISVDSASLANKGLEVIEAAKLFDLPASKVKVLVHPQSQIHALIRMIDGSLYAQISNPDMRLPLHNAMFYPNVRPCSFGKLDLANCTLSFEQVDFKRFPMLSLAYSAITYGGFYPVAYNAADEIAVSAFLEQRISFTDISRIAHAVLNSDWSGDDSDFNGVMDSDTRARVTAIRAVEDLN